MPSELKLIHVTMGFDVLKMCLHYISTKTKVVWSCDNFVCKLN